MQKKPFYITTTLPYVNANPHVGFAFEVVMADVIARYKRGQGTRVFFNTGTDEHGQKIFQAAEKKEQSVQEYVDHYAGEFRKLKDLFGLSTSRFIRTTDADHIAAAQELWKRCEANGDIYKKKYKGLYCVADEMFLKESELVNGKCPNHPTMDPVEIEEENYFFKLSAYQDKLLIYLSRHGVILPEWRRIEAVKFVKGGLEDLPISRTKQRVPWGIPIVGDDTQVMYVWFDALTNYISTLGWPNENADFKKFWTDGEVVQCAGKDQVRFQSIIWQAMLMSGGVKNTDKVVYHGFINSGGQKMSKSIGNVLSPFDVIDLFKPYTELATDALRYYLLRHVNTFDDSDMTVETVKEAYQANLANGLGNLVSRIMTLSEKYGEPFVPKEAVPVFPIEMEMVAFDVQKAMNVIWNTIGELDAKIAEEKPFSVVKEDEALGKEMIASLVADLHFIASGLKPFLPETSEKILDLIVENKKPEVPLFRRLD
ncbi:MAG TPA: methionine--tRNA ligase [Candidatus Paceibacterota bacterium]|nr:methionine--tRNA ligase [Candidatus Paceibacterota bacterium]